MEDIERYGDYNEIDEGSKKKIQRVAHLLRRVKRLQSTRGKGNKEGGKRYSRQSRRG